MTDGPQLIISLGGAVITALVAAVGVLWKENKKWQTRWIQEHNKRLEDLKEHGRTSEIFLRALEKRRNGSSEAPQSR